MVLNSHFNAISSIFILVSFPLISLDYGAEGAAVRAAASAERVRDATGAGSGG